MPGTWKDYEHYRQTSENQQKYGQTSTWVNALIGGPAGWFKEATGEKGLGGTYGEHHAYAYRDPNTFANQDIADKYNAAALDEATFNSMTDEEIQAFENMDYNQRVNFLKKRRAAASQQGQVDKAEQERQAREVEYQQWRRATMQRLEQFSKEMGKPLDQLLREGDLGAQSAYNTGANQAQSAAYSRGVGGGGLSAMNTQRAALDAGMGYQLQRQQMGAQATQGLMGALNQEYMNEEDRRRYEQGLNLQLQQAQQAAYNQQYMQNSQRAGGTFGLIGAGLGAYFGGAAGAQAGYTIGSGLGSQHYQQSNPYQSYRYRYPSGSLGSNRNQFGGSQ